MLIVNRTGYMTLREAAAWLGIGEDRAAGRRLRRLLETVERTKRRHIIRRLGSGNGARLYVTRAVLRDYLPEHFEKRSQMESMVRERFEILEREQQIARKERRFLGARILRVEKATTALATVPTSAH